MNIMFNRIPDVFIKILTIRTDPDIHLSPKHLREREKERERERGKRDGERERKREGEGEREREREREHGIFLRRFLPKRCACVKLKNQI